MPSSGAWSTCRARAGSRPCRPARRRRPSPCSGRTASAHGPPISAGGLVWSIGGNSLYGINPSTGATVEQLTVGSQANHFPTPSVGDGLLLAPASNQVVAFAGSAGIPGPPSPPTGRPPPNSSYWLVASDGGIFTFGNAGFYGSTGGIRLNQPVVGMAPTAIQGGLLAGGVRRRHLQLRGRRLLRIDGGPAAEQADRRHGGDPRRRRLLARGVRRRHLQLRRRRLLRIDGRQAAEQADRRHGGDPRRAGYWLVASDGGIFSFGDAAFHGSMGGQPLNKPIVGMASTPDGLGYWLVASDGGIFNFGDAGFFGSAGGLPLSKPAVGMAPTPDGRGYWIAASDGGIFNYGDANFSGSDGRPALEQAGRRRRVAQVSRPATAAASRLRRRPSRRTAHAKMHPCRRRPSSC